MNFKNMKKIKKIAAAALIMTALMSMQAQAAFIAAPGVEVGSDNEKQGPWSESAETNNQSKADASSDTGSAQESNAPSDTEKSYVIYAPGTLSGNEGTTENTADGKNNDAGSDTPGEPAPGDAAGSTDYAAQSKAAPNTLIPANDSNIFYINGRSIDITKPSVALTYDDGPQTTVGNRIMDIMAQYGQKCTFFMVGDRVGARAAEVQRMAAEGHELANHTYGHVYLNKVGAESIRQQVTSCNDVIEQVSGVRPSVMRLPGGNKNQTVISNVNMPIILWNIDTRDWATRNAESTKAAVIGHVNNGDIVLMHELYESTANATSVIVPTLVEHGFQLVTVSELAAIRGVTLQPNHIYYSF